MREALNPDQEAGCIEENEAALISTGDGFEEEWQDDQQALRVVEQASFGVLLIDSQFRISLINEGAQPVFQNVRPLIGRDLAEALRIIWPEPFATEAIERFRHTLRTGESYLAPSFTHRRLDLEAIAPHEWQLHRVEMPNRQFGVVGYFYDSARLRRAEWDAQESQTRFGHVFEAAGVSVSIQDFSAVKMLLDGLRHQRVSDLGSYLAGHPEFVRRAIRSVRVVDVNQATLELFAAQTKDRMLRSFADVFGRARESFFLEALLAIAEGRESLHAEVPVRALDDRPLWVLLCMRFSPDSGDYSRVVTTLTDITKHRNAESAIRKRNDTLERRVQQQTRLLRQKESRVRELGALLTMAEHEERNRLAQVLHDDLQQLLYSVQMKLWLLRDGSEAAERATLRQMASEAEQWVAEAVEVTRRLAVDLNPQVLESEGVTEAVQWLAVQMHELHGLQVQVCADDSIVLKKTLRVLLFQAIRELLFNIVKHAGVNQARVELHVDNNGLLVRVSDHGKGLDAESLGEGNGFGILSIKHRLTLVGARLEIELRPGGGTIAAIHMPAQGEES